MSDRIGENLIVGGSLLQPVFKPRRRYRRKPGRPWALVIVAIILLVGVGLHYHHSQSVHTVQKTIAVPIKQFHQPTLVVLPTQPITDRLPFPIGEDSGLLWNLSSGQLLWSYHPHLKGPYASTTKLMTIYLAMHQLPLTKTITIRPLAAATTGSDINMKTGDHFTVRQLYYGLLMRSANNAAVAVAQAASPSVPAFVREMNQTAQRMGMYSTTYGDPDGLSRRSAGTAWDLSIIARADMQYPLFRKIVDTRRMPLPYNSVVQNLDGLLFLDPSVIGIKSGWTTAAGFNLVFAATREVNGHPVTLMGVIMHGQMGFPPEYQDAEHILNWGFSQVKAGSSTQP